MLRAKNGLRKLEMFMEAEFFFTIATFQHVGLVPEAEEGQQCQQRNKRFHGTWC